MIVTISMVIFMMMMVMMTMVMMMMMNADLDSQQMDFETLELKLIDGFIFSQSWSALRFQRFFFLAAPSYVLPWLFG